MGLLSKWLFKYTASRPARLISAGDAAYLERYYLGKAFGLTFYLHRFVSADKERHLHSHPWRWGGSIILSGSYVEEVFVDFSPGVFPEGCLTRKAVRWLYNPVHGNTYHRIHNAKLETWTLFFHSAMDRDKGWGFFDATDDGLCTVFRRHVSRSHPTWWLDAPLGRDIGRTPYGQRGAVLAEPINQSKAA